MKSGTAKRRTLIVSDRLFKQRLVFLKLNRLEDQSRVCRGVLRRILPDRFKISSIGDNRRKLLKLIQLAYCGKCRAHSKKILPLTKAKATLKSPLANLATANSSSNCSKMNSRYVG